MVDLAIFVRPSCNAFVSNKNHPSLEDGWGRLQNLYLCCISAIFMDNQFEIVNAKRRLLQEMSCSRTEWRILTEELRKLMSCSRAEWRILRSFPRTFVTVDGVREEVKLRNIFKRYIMGQLVNMAVAFPSETTMMKTEQTNKPGEISLFIMEGEHSTM